MSQSRQLAAIMFTDIVGYTALMGEDEQQAFELLKKNRIIQRPIIEKFNGRWLKEIGDGVLASFPTVTDAVYCAATIQKTCENESDLRLRIGIHLGEVVFEGNDVFGDGVNIASRLEPLAPIGGILVSESVNRNLGNKKNIVSTFLREERLKNVKQSVRIYSILVEGAEPVEIPSASPHSTKDSPKTKKPGKVAYISLAIIALLVLAFFFYPRQPKEETQSALLIDKSIAVLPFRDISPNKDQEWFCDGMTEAILNRLVKIPELKVTSNTSTRQYKNTTKTIPQIAQELDVSYLLESSVQVLADSVRITAQLVGSNDQHLWSDQFDRPYSDIFNIQSSIAENIVSSMEIIIDPEVKGALQLEPTKNTQAYDYYLKGEDYYSRSRTINDYIFAIQMFERAVASDSAFTLAWVGLAKASRNLHHFHISPHHQLLAKEYLEKANTLAPDLLEVQLETARYYYHCETNYTKALEILDKLQLQYPNYDELNVTIAHIYRRMGQFNEALDHQDRAIALNPYDWIRWSSRSYTLIILKRYTEAETNSKKVIELNPSLDLGYTDLSRLYLIVGDTSKFNGLLKIYPNIAPITISHYEMIRKNYHSALEVTESSDKEVVSTQYLFLPKLLQLGLCYYMMSNQQLAQSYFSKSVEILEDYLNEYPEDSRIYSSLGIAYAGLGMTQEAVTSGEKALSIMNFSIDFLRGFQRDLDMAKILLMIGEYDKAITKLEFLIQQNGYLSVELLKLDPFWDPLRKMRAFQELINNPKYQISWTP